MNTRSHRIRLARLEARLPRLNRPAVIRAIVSLVRAMDETTPQATVEDEHYDRLEAQLRSRDAYPITSASWSHALALHLAHPTPAEWEANATRHQAVLAGAITPLVAVALDE